VISTTPANNTTGVAVGSSIAATFSEALNPLTVSTATFTVLQGNVLVPGSVAYAGVTAIFTPFNTLAANSLFTATINTGIRDLSGNALAGNYVWSFTTGSTPIVTPPAVISTSPISGAALVTVTTDVIANFSEPMNPLTLNTATFTLTQAGNAVPGSVTYVGTSATFRPALRLTANTTYQATVSSVAADLSGNQLTGNYTWSFTTGSSSGQTSVCLASFAVLSGGGVINTGPSLVTGDIGVSNGSSVTGFPPGTIKGTIRTGDATETQAILDLTAAYTDATTRSIGPVPVSGDIGGRTFTAGLYKSTSSLSISAADLTLDAKGDATAVFIFQVATTFTTSLGRQVILAGGAKAYNVFWQVAGATTLGTNSVFQGSILSNQSITLNAGAAVTGRLLSLAGGVSLQSNVISSPAPGIFLNGIINAAGDTATVAAGSIAAVFGNDLGSSLVSATAYPLPTTLGGGSFQVGNVGAPLFMTYCTQTNLQIPWESVGQTQVPVSATVGGQTSAQTQATIVPYAPGIFTLNMAGSGQGAVEIAPTSQLAAPLSSAGQPVARGQYIAIWCTGLGPVTNQPATGAAALSNPLSYTLTAPIVTVGGASAQVTYSGLAPGFAGLYQVNAVIPAGAPSGSNVALVLNIGGIASNSVTIAVQ
jgi:uncharacterized protein (TIGR03437 family)